MKLLRSTLSVHAVVARRKECIVFRGAGPRLLAGSLIVLAAGVTAGDVVTLQPVDDAFILYGGGGNNSEVLDQFGYYSNINRPLIKFDLSSIPDGATVLSAELTLQLMGIYGGQGHFTSAWRMPNDQWAEETVTWNAYDRTGAVSVAILPGAHDLGARVWSIRIADWNYAEDVLDEAVTFMMRWDDSGGGYETDGYYKWNTYSSKEGTVAPTLRIEYAPPLCRADVDGDGFVTGDDFQLFVEWFEIGDIRADFDGDGFITGDDFGAFVEAFEIGC